MLALVTSHFEWAVKKTVPCNRLFLRGLNENATFLSQDYAYSRHRDNILLAHDISVIHIIIPNAFLRLFHAKNHLLHLSGLVFASNPLVIHYVDSSPQYTIYLARDILVIQIIIPMTFSEIFLVKI